VAYDPERFAAVYLSSPLPLDLGDGWALASVDGDRIRAAIDLRLTHPDGRSLLVFVERRVDGAQAFARTARLQVSYYADGAGVHDGLAARLTRAVVQRLEAAERGADPDTLDAALAVDARSATGRARTLELRVNRECNERCVFCNTPEDSDTIVEDPESILAAIHAERAAGYSEITLTGREPTLDPNLPRYVEAAREAGYAKIRVQTNGTTFAHRPTLDRLVAAGMNAAELSLHTFDRETFARLIGPPRLLDKTLAGLRHLAEVPRVTVHVTLVLTRLNLDHAPDVIARIAEAHPGVAQVTLSPMAPVGDGAAQVELIPRPAELTEPLARAFEAADRAGLGARIPSRCGAPLCVMPPGRERHNDEHGNDTGRTLEAGKRKPPQCAGCRWDARCTGLWSAALDRWGDDVVQPVG